MSTPAWKVGGELYLPYIAQIETEYGVPTDLLARIAYQESTFNPNAVNPKSGAVGMFQLEPADFPGAASMSWQEQAETAAKFLVVLHRQFNDWQMAVAAYDWGPGNMSKYEDGQIATLPDETRNYITEVFTDVPIEGALYGTLEA
jgi:soluble lytic murein transglycosylase-like protein